jgi:hypothetical protein
MVNADVKYLVLGMNTFYCVKYHSNFPKRLFQTNIINILEFLIDNIFTIFVGRVLSTVQ